MTFALRRYIKKVICHNTERKLYAQNSVTIYRKESVKLNDIDHMVL